MSQENVEIVRRAYAAFNEEVLDAFLEYYHPDLEYDITKGSGPWAGMYHDRESVRRFLADYMELWEYVRMEPEEFTEVGDDQVIVLIRLRMKGKGSGIEVKATTLNVWTVHDGKAARIAVVNSKAEALDSVGLSE